MVPMLLRHAAVLRRAARGGLLVALLLHGGALKASARVTGQADGRAAAPPVRRDAATPTPMPPHPPAEVVEYYHVDALALRPHSGPPRASEPAARVERVGSVRLVTDESGQVLRHHDFLPFGEEYHAAGWVPENPPADRKLFTGQERDVELGLDYFGARYYRANIGRFTTVDPAVIQDQALADPQLWNRYAYVRNNPLRYVDPDGRDPQDPQAQKSFFVNSMTFLGSALGVLIGGTGGAAGGTFVEPVGGTIAGGAYGALQGSVLGAAAGRATAEAIVAGVSYMSDASEGHGGWEDGSQVQPRPA